MRSSRAPNAYYAATVEEFLGDSLDIVVGRLVNATAHGVDAAQAEAWREEAKILQGALAGLDGTLLLEFSVPRIGSRIDAVILVGGAVFVIEFKVGESQVRRGDLDQVWDYALDLKNFHQASHDLPIVPILIATDCGELGQQWAEPAADDVFRPVPGSPDELKRLLHQALERIPPGDTDAQAWMGAPYRPTPTIIEAARALYAHHSVEAIARSDAGARNLAVTSTRVEAIIETARLHREKAIVFVTGVPGAGKTLVGLEIATRKRADSVTHAVFLSGNGPLVKVLREALTLDELRRQHGHGKPVRKGDIQQRVKAFIQNVHHFRDEGLNQTLPPSDKVVIFDEAQRAWDRSMTADFMKRKKGRPGFEESEPEFLLSYMSRHPEWAVVICLVGGGQEINRGEAGISAWLEALAAKHSQWRVHLSPHLVDSEYAAEGPLGELRERRGVTHDEALHLSVSLRSFRAERVSRLVKAVLDQESVEAGALVRQLLPKYPIAVTRDLAAAKSWVRARARGSERFGLVASSKARRLKPEAVDVRYEVDPVHWFLNERDDTRSSYYLEDAATEFQVQGLELDWVCVAWDADLRQVGGGWDCFRFDARGWRAVRNEANRTYLRNAYRVLLTRARQGMVIYVPKGDSSDPTRAPDLYDGTFDYLRSLGLSVV